MIARRLYSHPPAGLQGPSTSRTGNPAIRAIEAADQTCVPTSTTGWIACPTGASCGCYLAAAGVPRVISISEVAGARAVQTAKERHQPSQGIARSWPLLPRVARSRPKRSKEWPRDFPAEADRLQKMGSGSPPGGDSSLQSGKAGKASEFLPGGLHLPGRGDGPTPRANHSLVPSESPQGRPSPALCAGVFPRRRALPSSGSPVCQP